MKLRLLITKACNRRCPGCCNGAWSLDALDRVGAFTGYDEIMLTGGEPMLDPMHVLELVQAIRNETTRQTRKPRIFVYTAKVDEPLAALAVLSAVDGMTLTLHEQRDVHPFVAFNGHLRLRFPEFAEKSLRLNVFDGVEFPRRLSLDGWDARLGMRWRPNCPLPADEVFMRL